MDITKDTNLKDLITKYPWLKEEMVKINDKFRMLNTPVGKVMIGKATIAEMSRRSGLEINELIRRINNLVDSHK